jgi:hypothetical protein
MRRDEVEAIAQEGTRRGQVIGVRVADPGEEESDTPWMRAPSGRAHRLAIAGQFPAEARGAISQRFFLEKGELPSALLNPIKRIAAFQNPEFYKKQRMRLSNAMTPRVITCAEDLAKHVALPRGFQAEVEALL